MLESPEAIGLVVLALVANLVGALLVYVLVRRHWGLGEASNRPRAGQNETRGPDATGPPDHLGPGHNPEEETAADSSSAETRAGTKGQQEQAGDAPKPPGPAVSRTVRCPACGTENRAGYRFCRSCVSELPKSRQSGARRSGALLGET